MCRLMSDTGMVVALIISMFETSMFLFKRLLKGGGIFQKVFFLVKGYQKGWNFQNFAKF